MKILHITDSHGTVKPPESRTDVYYLSFLKKMYELKYVIQQNDIKLIIHTGDLFHSARVSDKFAGQLAEIIKSYGIPMYVVPGNHDIEGYTINTLDQTKLGLLYKTGVVKELDRGKNPIQLKHQKENLNISIVGQEYYKDIDTGNMSDFEMRNNNPNANFNILAIHGYLCNSPQHPDVKCTQCKDIVTDADVILAGHFHEAFEYHGADFSVYNPGSMMRVEQTTYNKTHLPQYGILEITNNNGVVQHTYTMHPFKVAEPSEKVFDYTLKNQKKKTLITLENFKNSIANTNFNSNLNTSIENIINNVAGNLSVTQDIIDKTIDVYHDALNNSPDKLEVQQGYIADVSRKIIKHVEIKNFQSHESTIVEFKDGLNTIIGESNSGKCVRGDSYVKTKSGLRQIKDLFTETLKEDTFYDTNESVIITGNTEKLGALYYSGIKKSILISLSNGRELECSYEEPLLIWNSEKFCEEFKKACDLTTDDLLIRDVKPVKINKTNVLQEIDWSYDKTVYANYLLQHENISNVNELQDKVKCSHAAADRNFYHRNNFNIILPKYLNEDLAYIIGLIDGDGCISKGNYCTSDEFLKNEYTRIIKENFNESVDFIERKGLLYTKGANGTFSLIVKGIMKAQGQNANTKKVPQIIKMSPWHIQLEYVKGIMDTDGSVDKNGRLELSMNSKDIVLFVKEFVESIGYDGVLTKRGKSWRYCFSHSRFTTNHGSLFRLPRKKEREIQKEKLTGPNKEILKGSAKWFKTQNISFTREQRKQIAGHTISDYNVRDITVSAYNTFIDKANKLGIHIERRIPEYHTVCSINSIKENVCDLYDVTNPISHTFTANGFIVHNTSILRAIRWCLDNDPKGSDFITTGRDDCSVTVVFDDGTSITRKRTRNDSGTYDVVGKTIQPDGTVSKWTQTYKGFANNLPIEIMNIHQMPKVNLTKDICTHLNMMSQLDGPFLVTESPQVKAAIIGRLTGTQIIDLGIKETNKKILSNSKTIKTYTQEKTDRENELFRYQYLPFYERYVRGFDLICKYCESKMNTITNVEMILDELYQRRKVINDITNNIVQIQNNIDMYNIMLAIKTYMAKQLEIIDMYNELKDAMLHIKSLQKQIKWLIILTSFRSFVDSANLKVGLYGQLANGYTRATSLHQQISDNTNLCNNLTAEIAVIETAKKCFSDIYKYVQVLSQDISNTKGVYDKYVIRRQNANQQSDIAVQWNAEVNHLTSQIEKLTNQQKQIIKQNNVCPCCGQKITSEEHVLNINNFMKGR